MCEEWPPIPHCRTVSTTPMSVSRLENCSPIKSGIQTSYICCWKTGGDYIQKKVSLMLIFVNWQSCFPLLPVLLKAECAHFAANLYFPVKLQTGDAAEECLSGMKTASIEFNLVFTYVVDEFGNKEVPKPFCWGLNGHWDVLEDELLSRAVLFLFIRPDRSSGW